MFLVRTMFVKDIPLFTHANNFLKTKEKLFLLCIWYICLNSCVTEAASENCSTRQIILDSKIDVLQKLWKSLALVKLVHAYNSTKDKLLLKYFIRKIIWKNTSNSSRLLLVFLNLVIRTLFCFWWLCSKEIVVTLKCYYEKDSLVENTLKECLPFKFSMTMAKYFLESDI